MGVLILGVIGNIMNLASVPGYHQQVVMGVIIVAAVLSQRGARFWRRWRSDTLCVWPLPAHGRRCGAPCTLNEGKSSARLQHPGTDRPRPSQPSARQPASGRVHPRQSGLDRRHNLAELARNAQVSEPTVLRFCATIGCSGFSDFKMRMVQSLALGAPATHSVLAGRRSGKSPRRSSTTRSPASTGRARSWISLPSAVQSICLPMRSGLNFSASEPQASSHWTRSRSFRSSACRASRIRIRTSSSSPLQCSSPAMPSSRFRTRGQRVL